MQNGKAQFGQNICTNDINTLVVYSAYRLQRPSYWSDNDGAEGNRGRCSDATRPFGCWLGFPPIIRLSVSGKRARELFFAYTSTMDVRIYLWEKSSNQDMFAGSCRNVVFLSRFFDMLPWPSEEGRSRVSTVISHEDCCLGFLLLTLPEV